VIRATPFLAELGSIEKFVITALAVAGGFLVGFLLTNVIARLLCKFVWKREPPEKLIRIIRFAGGVGAAILVYLLLMGDGGLGFGGKGGGNSADDKGKENAQNPPNNAPPEKDPKKEELKQKDHDSRSGILTVYLLQNNAEGMRIFKLGKDGKPMTLEQLLEQIDLLSMNKKQPIVQVDIEIGDPDYSVLAVSRLETELNDRGIKSTRPIIKKPSGKN
jgi:hypothetical protein